MIFCLILRVYIYIEGQIFNLLFKGANMEQINSINAASPAVNQTNIDKNTEKLKELVQKYNFDYFDLDNDGKLSGAEAAKLRQIFNSVDFDVDDEDAIDESSFNDALSDYK